MKNESLRNAAALCVGFVVLWYVGARFDFFPFMADDLAVRASGFTGLLLCAVLVVCTCWIVDALEKN